MLNLEKKIILKTHISICDYEWVVQRTISYIDKKQGLLIFPLATHTLIEAYFNKSLQKILNSYDILTLDSQWLTWSLNWLYGITLKKRVYGPDLMLNFLNEAEKQKIPIFLFGTNEKTLTQLEKIIKLKFQSIKIVGSLPAPYHVITRFEKEIYKNIINKSKAKIVFISLSSPKQVVLAYDLFKLCSNKITMFPVGAGFDFVAKTKKQAPQWMQDNGLEWFYRLCQEPRRLGLRYLKTGSLFFILVFIQKMRLVLKLNKL